MPIEPYKKGLLLAKIESAYGTDPTPTSSANVIAAVGGDVQFEAEAELNERDVLDGTFDQFFGEKGKRRAKIRFRTELRGNRTDGTAPDISAGSSTYKVEVDCLLRACDMTPTYSAEATSGSRDGLVSYSPTFAVDTGDSVTIYFYSALKLHKLTGCKGNAKITLEAGKYGFIDWEFQGRYVAVTDATFPASPTFLDTYPPLFKKNASAGTWGGVTATFTKADIDLGNAVEMRSDFNSPDALKGFLINNRNITGNIDPESVDEATDPVWADWSAGTVRLLSLDWGTQTGNKLQIRCYGRADKVAYSNRAGARVQSVNFGVSRTSLSAAAGSQLKLNFL